MPGADEMTALPRRPASCTELFTVFTRLALQGFGGVLPVAQRELVERQRWLTAEQFLEVLALGQVLPGPNVVNLALMVGQRFFGHRGALAAMAGMLCVPLVGVLLLAALAAHWQRYAVVTGALRGMGIVSAGLIVAAALRLAVPLKRSPLTPAGAAGVVGAAFVAVGLLRWPLVAVVIGLGGVACGWAAWRLRAAAASGRHG
ncbi:MAG: chromate transporter [Burkholderiales bacterium]|nr:chromate transporter [Burkholderiales bacterium]